MNDTGLDGSYTGGNTCRLLFSITTIGDGGFVLAVSCLVRS